MTQPRRLGAFVLAALCFVLLRLPHLGATQKESAHAAIIIVTPEANKSTLEEFSWLAGRWEGHLGPMTAEQQWMAPKNGTMQGFFRLTDAEKRWSSNYSRFAKRPAASSFTSAIFLRS